jgi:hypothetical protein
MRININSVTRAKIKTYIKQNWGTPFVVLFMLLLVVAALFLSIGSTLPAEVIGALAYFSLVAGVILQLARFLKYDKGQEKQNHDSD